LGARPTSHPLSIHSPDGFRHDLDLCAPARRSFLVIGSCSFAPEALSVLTIRTRARDLPLCPTGFDVANGLCLMVPASGGGFAILRTVRSQGPRSRDTRATRRTVWKLNADGVAGHRCRSDKDARPHAYHRLIANHSRPTEKIRECYLGRTRFGGAKALTS
jgi:hypothetical protein